MAINNHSAYTESGGIRSETNVQGRWVDAQQAYAEKAHEEHSLTDESVPWSQSYKPNREVLWEEETEPVALDPALTAANKQDLKIRNIPSNY